MALTQLADLVRHEHFAEYTINRLLSLSNIFNSGAVVRSQLVDDIAKSGTSGELNIPFLNQFAGDSLVSNDDPASIATPAKQTTGKDRNVIHFRNKPWSQADLVSVFVGDDPLASLGDFVAQYWDLELQKIMINSLRGIFADNETNDSSDMIFSVATDAAGAITDAEKISSDAIIEADKTIGDQLTGLNLIMMHSHVYAQIRKKDLISFVPASESKSQITTYMGKQVIVNDALPAIAGTHRITYHTYLLGTGSFLYGEGRPKIPFEIDRAGLQGNGGGVEVAISRKHFIIHPQGTQFKSATMASTSPSNAELALAANWDRVKERKALRMALIKTNG